MSETLGSIWDDLSFTSSLLIQRDEGSRSPEDPPIVSAGFDTHGTEVTPEISIGKEIDGSEVTLERVVGAQTLIPGVERERRAGT